MASIANIAVEVDSALRAEIDRLNLELQKRDKCSYMGPMRDCPTHGEGKDAARYRWLRDNPTWIGYDSDFRPDEVDAVIDAAMLKTPNARSEARPACGTSLSTEELDG